MDQRQYGNQNYRSSQPGGGRPAYGNQGQQGRQSQQNMVTIEGQTTSIADALKNIAGSLKKDLEAKQDALPKGFSRDRFVLNTQAMLKDQLRDYDTAKKFAGISYNSIISCFEKAAFLGLDFFNGECYAIPYGKSLQFQTDYKGEIKLCKAYSTNPILNIFAKVVRRGDEYLEEVVDGDQTVTFKPIPFSDGDIIGAFAIVKFKDGSMAYDSMSRQEIENIRTSYSKAANSPAWQKSYGEMCKKTVLRRLSKMIDKNFNADQLRAYEDGGDAMFHQTSEPNQDMVVDSTARDITDAFEAAKEKQKPEPKQITEQKEAVKPVQKAASQQKIPDPVPAEQVPQDEGRQEQYDESWARFEQTANDSGNTDEMPFA